MGALDNHLKHFLASDSRLWPRHKCNYITECSNNYGNRWACKVVDLSERGLGIVSSAKMREGDTINIADPKTKASVVWVEKGRAGLRVCT
jgi:hypothetical protein